MTTIARVAALAGVGVGTVSRVLNDSGAVSASTRRRVEEAIEALDYEPSAAARALSTGRTMSLGVVAPFLTQPSVVERLRGVARRVSDAGYRLVLLDVERPDALFDTVGTFAVNGRVDGLLVVSLAVPPDFRAGSVPTVLVDRDSDELPSVHIDDEAGGRLATEHLLGLGHTAIAFIGDTEENPYGFVSSARRRLGYEAALRDADVKVDPALIRTAPHGRDAARALTRELLEAPVPPTAIFAASDDQALGVLEARRGARGRSARPPLGRRVRRHRGRALRASHDRRAAARDERRPRRRPAPRRAGGWLAALGAAGLRARHPPDDGADGLGEGERTRGKASGANAAAQWHDANVP